MTKRPECTERTQPENRAGPELAHLVEPMLAGMTVTRQHRLAWVHAQGLAALDELFCEEAEALAGPKGRHQAPRTHHHWGTTATELTFGGRRLCVRRPSRAGGAHDRARRREFRGARRVSHHGHRRRNSEGHHWLRIDLLEGAGYVGIPRLAVN
jgi:hypothetical protein